MDPSDPDIRAIGPNAMAIAGLGTLPAEVILMIARLADNSRDMLRLAKVNRHCYRTIVHKAWEHDVKVTGECRCLLGNVELNNIEGVVRAVRNYGAGPSVLHTVPDLPEFELHKLSALGVAIEHFNPLVVRTLLDLGCGVDKPSQGFYRIDGPSEELPPLLQLLLFNHGTWRLKTHPLAGILGSPRRNYDISARGIDRVDKWCREARQLASVLCEVLQILVDHGADINAATTGLPAALCSCSPMSVAIMSGMPAEVISLLLSLSASPIPRPPPRCIFDTNVLLFYACIWDSIDHNQRLTEPVTTTLLKFEDPRPRAHGPKWVYFNRLIGWIKQSPQTGLVRRSVYRFGTTDHEQRTLFTRIIDREVAKMANVQRENQLSLLPATQQRTHHRSLTLLGAWVEAVRMRPTMVNEAKAYISILVDQKGVDHNGPCLSLSSFSPLHWICGWNLCRSFTSQRSSSSGSPVLIWNVPTISKRTPLHVACKGEIVYEETVDILLEAGANPMAEDAQGQTPLDFLQEGMAFKPGYIQNEDFDTFDDMLEYGWTSELFELLTLEATLRERLQQQGGLNSRQNGMREDQTK
ncbi:hypothetical protein PoMZ_04775 [Pyricularia oryzae]|uniref:Uncharacterized protein n=1 Tax=Pyricularia oryzae TaxID=318829 RepID=A0A4P7NCU5_PYROR|nr:hypothetical protein PoMZ_04775 [Pyricularia oryzae]